MPGGKTRLGFGPIRVTMVSTEIGEMSRANRLWGAPQM